MARRRSWSWRCRRIALTTRTPYKKRLREHLTETKAHGREVAKRIKQLGRYAGPLPQAAPEALAHAAEKAQEVASRVWRRPKDHCTRSAGRARTKM